MKFNFLQKQTSRREMLRDSATLAGSAFLAHLLPATLPRASAAGYAQQALSPAELLASMRAKFNAVPMETQKLADNVTMFDGPGNAPLKYVIDTHWHFDHTDNNAPLHAAGATVLAHENTRKRMSEPHDLPVLYRGPNGALVDVHAP